MDVQIGPRTEMTEDRSDQGPKWMHTSARTLLVHDMIGYDMMDYINVRPKADV